VINEWWFGKDLEQSGRVLILRLYYGNYLEGLRKSTRNFGKDSRSPCRHLSPQPPEDGGVLTTRPQSSASRLPFWLSMLFKRSKFRVNPYLLFSWITWKSRFRNVASCTRWDTKNVTYSSLKILSHSSLTNVWQCLCLVQFKSIVTRAENQSFCISEYYLSLYSATLQTLS
jgi:hypothetical protein